MLCLSLIPILNHLQYIVSKNPNHTSLPIPPSQRLEINTFACWIFLTLTYHKNLKPALQIFDSLILKFPGHPGALYGKAKVLDRLSTKYKNNQMLQDAIEAYRVVLKLEDKADDKIYREAGERCVQLLRFGGNSYDRKLISQFQVCIWQECWHKLYLYIGILYGDSLMIRKCEISWLLRT